MATLRELIEYSKANPTSDIASKTQRAIQAGAYDEQAIQEGVDLSWAGRPVQTPEPVKAPLKDRVADVLLKQAGKQAETVQRQKTGGQTIAETGVQMLGQGIGTAGGVAFETLRSIPGIGSLIDKGTEMIGEGVKPLIESERGMKAIQAYQNLDPRLKADLEGIFEIAGAIATPGAGKASAKALGTGIKTGLEVTDRAVVKTGQEALQGLAEKSIQKSGQRAMEATAKIIQGKTTDIAKGVRVLNRMDLEGVKTYQELSGAIQNSIKRNSKNVDQIYQSVPGARVLKDLSIDDVVELGGKKQKVSINYVEDALDQLDELYANVRQPKEQARIKLIKQKAIQEGLTPFEINEIAREYGSEFGSKAFSKKTGEALTSVNSQAYENTRKGIKETARGFLPDEASKKLDFETSEMIDIKRLTDQMAEKVQTLQQKVQKRGIGERIGNRIADFVDLMTLGSAKGFVSRFFPRNQGIKTLNSLDLQEQLKKNLKIVQEIIDSPDETVAGKILEYTRNPKLGASIEDVSKKGNPTMGKIAPYTGEKDLTTKILKDLEGKSTVSKQYILDATNRGELKQVERDLIREVLKSEKDTVNVSKFAEKVKAELLSLKRLTNTQPQYESISLGEDIRGNVKNYSENIYSSPIKTSAGQVHFGRQENTSGYFGHTRIEDMADNQTRRVIEVQSDLFQKGRLESEMKPGMRSYDEIQQIRKEVVPELRRQIENGASWNDIKELADEFGLNDTDFRQKVLYGETQSALNDFLLDDKFWKKELDKVSPERIKELSKLQQYNDPTAHFRMVREEIKKAAEDGKTKLQFPTGETAMKIEGIGTDTHTFTTHNLNGNEVRVTADNAEKLLSPGKTLFYEELGEEFYVIGEPRGNAYKMVGRSQVMGFDDIEDMELIGSKSGMKLLEQKYGKDELKKILKANEDNAETFTFGADMDGNERNPIYKFYEKEMQKYLSKFGGKRVRDAQGVEWIEVPVKKEWAKMPVEAFALIGGVGLASQMKDR